MHHHRATLIITPLNASRRISLDTDCHWSDEIHAEKHDSPDDYLPGTTLAEVESCKKDHGISHMIFNCAHTIEGLLNDDDLLALAEAATLHKPAALLDAHGGNYSGRWCYADEGKAHNVQRWISQQQRSHGLLLISVCNPRGMTITSTVPVIHCNRDYLPNHATMMSADARADTAVHIPGRGKNKRYINSYEYAAVARELAAKNSTQTR